MTPQEIKSLIQSRLEKEGFSHFGVTALDKPLSFEYYRQWISENLHGDMKYLEEHAPIKENPQQKWPRAQSAFVFGISYVPHPAPQSNPKLKQARTSLYAQGMDYHFWFREKMTLLCKELQEIFPEEEFLAFTDSSPILERDLAKKASLGWVGKNTCLIHPKKGSLFLIGEIFTSLKMTNTMAPLPDFCGHCTKCIDICPTQALVEPRKMDARKCISYLTIESRQVPPKDLREKMGDWFFGCDLCQTVCPWNQKVFKGVLSIEPQSTLNSNEQHDLSQELGYILKASGKQLTRDFAGTPLERAGSFGLKRNALIVIANRQIKELKDDVQSLITHEKLGELALWTLSKLEN